MANVDKMYTYLRGFLVGADMRESLKALGFARQQHSSHTRKDGTPYIVHPLSMACYAVAMGLREDNMIATILLHDVYTSNKNCVILFLLICLVLV